MGKYEAKKPEVKYTSQQTMLLYIHDLIYFLAVIIIVLLLFFRVVIVSGSSMYDTLVDGDYLLLISNTFYHNPKAGDIVVISKDSFDDGEPIVKRVIATGGQTVDIDFEAGVVYVDGVALDEPYTYTPTTTNGGTQFPLTVDEGCIFVMGDNRDRSRDSRYPELGQVDTREVLGKAVFVLFPGDPDGSNGSMKRDLRRIGVIS